MITPLLFRPCRRLFYPFMTTLVLLSLSGRLLAQDDFAYHPALTDSFTLSLGVFWSNDTFKLDAQGSLDQFRKKIDFGNKLGVDENSTLFNGQLRWRFGEQQKWSLWGQYFKSDSNGSRTLNDNIEWQGITFEEGTFARSGVSFEVERLFVGRSFVKTQQQDFGVGMGIHNLDVSAFIEGEIKANDGTTGLQRYKVHGSQILPNAGVWYLVSPARKWLVHARIDWISASIGDYNGALWNTSAGVNYQAFKHLGFDLAFQYFKLNANVNKSDWHGGVNLSYSGPVLSVTGNW